MDIPEPIDLGGHYYGEYVEFNVQFTDDGTAEAPGVGPIFKATPPGDDSTEGDYSHWITPKGGGAFKIVPVTTIPGEWSGRIYAEGEGQTSRDVIWVIAATRNP